MAIRRARARVALDQVRAAAKANGVDKMTLKQINAMIAEVRRQKRPAR